MSDPPRTSSPGVVDLVTPPTEPSWPHPDSDPLAALPALASTIDSYFADIPSFINELLTPHSSDLTPLDKDLNDLLTRLSLLSQDTSSALEQSIHDVSRTVPRLTYDLQFMRESATSLRSSLQFVQAQVSRQTDFDKDANSDEAKTYRALEKLSHLDKLKTRMESARDILREAESWSTLEGEITSLITAQTWDRAGERLAEASRSMVVFQNTPGEYENRRTLLVSLQNELETALSTALDEAISESDTDACSRFHDIFEMMERGAEFKNYYFAARRKGLVDEWNGVVLLDTAQAPPQVESVGVPTKFTTFLPRFYGSLLATTMAERGQVPLIFPPRAAATILSTFLQTTLDGLSPSMHSRLGALADYYGAEALPELIRAFKATEELALGVQGVLDKVAFNTQGGQLSGSALSPSPSAVSPITPEPKTPRSTRMSISRRFSRAASSFTEAGPSNTPTEWETTLYEPFLDLQASYASLERRYLSHQLKHGPLVISTAGSRPEKILSDRAAVVFSMADEAVVRNTAFTHGFGAKGLTDALDGFVETFLATSQDTILDMARRSTSTKSSAPDELDFEGLDYSTEDWGAFQLGLHILERCRDVRDRLLSFENRLHAAISAISTTSTDHPGTTIGAITLLQQSPLNSAELNSLLSSPGPEPQALPLAREALTFFTRASQLFLQEIILSPLRSQLDGYPSLPIWSQPEKTQRRGELQIPSFSLSPTDTISRVSEGLLNLLRVFEVHAADDALAYSLETLPFVDAETLSEMTTARPKAAPSGNGLGNGHGGAGMNAESVLSTWISSLTLTLLSHLTKSSLPSIRALSPPGAAQLASDLGYLSNAVRALDVEWEELERWREAVGVDSEEEWRRMKENVRGQGESEEVWKRVGGMRGWVG